MRNYIFRIFHGVIIALIALSIFGCGYKAAPQYVEEAKATTKEKK